MHMADALISPAVGGTMWVVTAGLIAYCARKLKQSMKDSLVPMMGVLGAFIFAAQMINFSIPGTGSSGHLGGGLILSVLLGPHAAFLVIASVLTVQALFFADGGLLALGCNIFNLGFFPAFIAYPFIYRVIARNEFGTFRHVARQATGKWPIGSRRGAWTAAIVAAVVGLQLGAFSVVLETKASGISELPFGTFVLLMQPIHLAIGIVEGLATAAVISFVARPVVIGLAIAALIIGGAISWFASTHPDGLEWSIAKVTGKEEISGANDAVHQKLAAVQEKTAFLPDYEFKSTEAKNIPAETAAAESESWPAVTAGTSAAGIVGGLITLGLACLVGFALKARRVNI
jgi:cobalt/nickel transport system permease protein